MRRGLVLSLMESDSPVTYLCNGGGRAIESAVINEVEGFPMRGEHSLRIFATAIIRTLVTDGVALVGSYEAMEDNPIGLMLMERLEAAQSMSVDAMREWLNNE